MMIPRFRITLHRREGKRKNPSDVHSGLQFLSETIQTRDALRHLGMFSLTSYSRHRLRCGCRGRGVHGLPTVRLGHARS